MFKHMNYFGKHDIPFFFLFDFKSQHPLVLPLEEVAAAGIFFDIKGECNFIRRTNLPEQINFQKFPISFSAYEKGFYAVQNHLKSGNSFLTNLTYPTRIQTNLSLRQILEHSNAKYKLLFKNKWVSFSPEPFIKIQDGQISSYPMKGTIDANVSNAAEQLLNNSKERAEHNTIVDLIRNDLSIIAKKVHVESFRYLEEVETLNGKLLQMSSKITGELPPNYRTQLGDILSKLLPAGSISGAPKKKTLEIIQAAEGYERAYYTGVFGYYANGCLESSVLIRFIEQIDDELYYKSGGGITVFSKAEEEYQELIAKVYVPIDRKYQYKTRPGTAHQLA